MSEDVLIFSAVLFGGYVMDRMWLSKASDFFDTSGYLVEPHWHLKGIMRDAMELHITKDFKNAFPNHAKLMEESKATFRSCPTGVTASLLCCWTLRKNLSDIHQKKKAIVLCGSQEKAQKFLKGQEQKCSEIKKLEEVVKKLKEKKPIPIALLAHSQRLRGLKQAMLPGCPVGPMEFFKLMAAKCRLQKQKQKTIST
jgi:hypothetical protein